MTATAGRDPGNPFCITPLSELLYNLAWLAVVAALAHYLFWVFAFAILPAMVGSVILMGVEQIIIGKDEAGVSKPGNPAPTGQEGPSGGDAPSA